MPALAASVGVDGAASDPQATIVKPRNARRIRKRRVKAAPLATRTWPLATFTAPTSQSREDATRAKSTIGRLLRKIDGNAVARPSYQEGYAVSTNVLVLDSPPDWAGRRDGLLPASWRRTLLGMDSRVRGNDGGGGFGSSKYIRYLPPHPTGKTKNLGAG